MPAGKYGVRDEITEQYSDKKLDISLTGIATVAYQIVKITTKVMNEDEQ
ncbi:hypothetical protein [Veronia pacifica]|nr:hypothetical protein [Veronia pacifica]